MTSGSPTPDELNTQIQYRLMEKLAESERRYRQLVENLREIVFKIDNQGKLTFLNPAWYETLGYLLEESNHLPLGDFLHPDDQKKWDKLLLSILEEKSAVRQELRFIHRNGELRWLEISAGPDPQIGALGTLTDITERKDAIFQLQYSAYHDALTGLLNRVAFVQELQQAIAIVQQNSVNIFAVLFLDLDSFKIVNDSLGHLIGDQLLIQVSDRLQKCVRPKDIVARFGGDEFILLLHNINSINIAISIAERIHQSLSEPFHLDIHEVFTSTSIGIVLSTLGIEEPEHFIRNADIALYKAKLAGKSCYEVFDSQMHLQAFERLQIETNLRKAIEREEFELYYQPIIELIDEQLVGFEALIRWHHPNQGLVAPGYFIGVAEESGLITPLGWWVLQKACWQMKEWQQNFSIASSLFMSVNLSSKQFLQLNLLEEINQAIKRVELPPESLKLEITESTMMRNLETTSIKLKQIQSLGIKISIDDFGTGYSSLSYLHNLPIDNLKIDRSFIKNMSNTTENIAIAKTIIDLAHNLGMDVTAEGVESAIQVKRLRRLGCEQVQGYFFAPPLPSSAIQDFFVDSFSKSMKYDR